MCGLGERCFFSDTGRRLAPNVATIRSVAILELLNVCLPDLAGFLLPRFRSQGPIAQVGDGQSVLVHTRRGTRVQVVGEGLVLLKCGLPPVALDAFGCAVGTAPRFPRQWILPRTFTPTPGAWGESGNSGYGVFGRSGLRACGDLVDFDVATPLVRRGSGASPRSAETGRDSFFSLPDGGISWIESRHRDGLEKCETVRNGALGVFARLVPALVFKTCGGCEQRPQWVRFPYTPARLGILLFALFSLYSDGVVFVEFRLIRTSIGVCRSPLLGVF